MRSSDIRRIKASSSFRSAALVSLEATAAMRGADNIRGGDRGYEELQDCIEPGIDGGHDHDKHPQPPAVLDKIRGPGRNGLADRKHNENKHNHAHCDGEDLRIRRLRGQEHETIYETEADNRSPWRGMPAAQLERVVE